jgi:ankyrin repeat protein
MVMLHCEEGNFTELR